MKIKQTIRKVLKEELNLDRYKERIISFMKENGIKLTIDFFGGWDKIRDTLEGYDIPKELMIDFIKEIINYEGPLSIFDLNEDPIYYGRTKDEYREIYYFGKRSVTVKVWDEDFNDLGDFDVSYEALDDSIIYNIFDMILEYYVTSRLDD